MSDKSWQEEYPIGMKFNVELVIVEHDPLDIRGICVRLESSLGEEFIRDWVNLEQLQKLMESTSPALKRKRLEKEIEQLQQQLKELGE